MSTHGGLTPTPEQVDAARDLLRDSVTSEEWARIIAASKEIGKQLLTSNHGPAITELLNEQRR